jgi:hypothetical protein
MPIEFKKNVAVFKEHVGVEDAEPLLAWLQKKPAAVIDLKSCLSLHASSLQVLMAAGLAVRAWPNDDNLTRWLQSALHNQSASGVK